MIAKPVGWTTGGSPRQLDPVESDINNLGPDEVVVEIDGREANRADFDADRDGNHTTHEQQEACRGVGGRVIEAGANALWYVDRTVIIPAGSRCGNCDASQRDKATARSGRVVTENDDDGTPARFVVVRADELCVMSVTTDWRKPR
jgi:threonine dehydrogenase-like Zn-dependent dehydrogenase